MAKNSLEHHGVLGMKWGIRRNRNKIGGRVSRKKKSSEEHMKSRELKKKATHTLTNAEIRTLTERLQLERNLNNLRPNAMKKGKNVVKGIVAAGTTIAAVYTFSQTPWGKSIAKAVTSAPITKDIGNLVRKIPLKKAGQAMKLIPKI